MQVNRRAGITGVTAYVGERFLHDPVSGLVYLVRQRPRITGHGHRHGQPGGLRTRDQAVQLAQAAAVAVLLAAQHAERGAQFPGGVRARLLDGQQRRRHVLTALSCQVHRHSGLNADHGDAVRQGIVQLTGDPQPLFHRHALGGLVPGPFGLCRTLLGVADVQLPHAERYGHDPSGDDPSGGVEGPPVAISAHSSSVRGASWDGIRPRDPFPATPRGVCARAAASPLTRQKSLLAHDDGEPLSRQHRLHDNDIFRSGRRAP